MAKQFRIVLVLLLACPLLIEGVISVPKIKGIIEAEVIEIPPGGLPLSLVRNKRQNFNASHIGVTARLNNDDHNVAVVHWSGYPSERIFVLTKQTVGGLYGRTTESFLWRSTDYGRTFVNETCKFPPDAVAHWYYISKDNNKIIFRDVVHNRLYVTTDEGDNYATYQLDFHPSRIHFSYSNASDSEYVYTVDTTTKKLYVSTNLGMNWTHIGSGVRTAYWTYLKDGQNSSFDDPSTIYFTLNTSTGAYRLMKARYPYHNNTEDIQEFDTALGDIVHFGAFYEYLFAVKNDASGTSLLVSYNRQPFAIARFPLSLEQKHYAVVDASEGEVFIAVYHNENFTNLYISDETGLYYSLTLEDVIANSEVNWEAGNGVFDVHVVEGIKGTYIANVEVGDGSYGASVISFDKGAEWVPLTAPTLDNDGVPLNCFPPNCSLHLHMDSSALYGFSDILSKETAVGLIMAQGNTGSSLRRSSYYNTKLYFSHDGGFSWQELFQYNHVFQFLDHGSIVVAVRLYAYTRVIQFSCDEGVTWNTYNIFDNDNPDDPDRLYVVGMFTELGEKVVHATVFGLEQFPFEEWLLVDLDFSLLNISVCNDSQYTTWVPTDERLGRRCLLGERLVYEKRISGECCINGPKYETPIHRSTCECAIEDFECDFSFERINIDSPCIPVRGHDPYAVPSDCPEGANYTVSTGYRRIAGDQCTIDETAENNYFLPEKIPCPIPAPEGLYIIQDTINFAANQSTQFELFQVAGGKLSTQYTWYWGDNTVNITVIGYEANKHQSHNYSHPGTYTITVTATNDGGTASVEKTITVLDEISSVIIKDAAADSPIMALRNEKLIFTAVVTSVAGTEYYVPVTYQWDFGNGDIKSSAESSITYSYSSSGLWNIALTVTNKVSSAAVVRKVDVSKVVSRIGISGPDIVPVDSNVTFSIYSLRNDEVIPSNTEYTWSFTNHISGTSNVTGTDLAQYTRVFPTAGTYEVAVLGVYANGSFTSSFTTIIRSKIGSIDIDIDPVIEINKEAMLFVHLYDTHNSTYSGSLNITFTLSINKSDASNFESAPHRISHTMLYQHADTYTVQVTAKNEVSMINRSVHIEVVFTNVSVIISFDLSNLKSTNVDYESTFWMDKFVVVIDNQITNDLQLPDWQLVAVVVNVADGDYDENFFKVQLDVLPETVQEQDLGRATDIANQLVHRVSSEGYSFTTPDNVRLTVSDAKIKEHFVVAEPQTGNSSSKLAIELGVGGGVALLVAIVLCVVGIAYYRRKYHRLEVQYSRLRQSDPVHFNVTDDTSCGETSLPTDSEEDLNVPKNDEL